jgi:hypothetical protein
LIKVEEEVVELEKRIEEAEEQKVEILGIFLSCTDVNDRRKESGLFNGKLFSCG